MQQDMEIRRALETIQSVLAGVSTTAPSRNLESLIDLVQLALWHPDEKCTLMRMRTPQLRRCAQGVEQDGGAVPGPVTYWRN